MEINVLKVKENKATQKTTVILEMDVAAKQYLMDHGITRILENAIAFEQAQDQEPGAVQ